VERGRPTGDFALAGRDSRATRRAGGSVAEVYRQRNHFWLPPLEDSGSAELASGMTRASPPGILTGELGSGARMLTQP
jgi:hypothetical protein